MDRPSITFINEQSQVQTTIELREDNQNKVIFSFNEFAQISVVSNVEIYMMVNFYQTKKQTIKVTDKYLKLNKTIHYKISFTTIYENCYSPGNYEILYDGKVYYFNVYENNDVLTESKKFMVLEISKLNKDLVSEFNIINKYNDIGINDDTKVIDFLKNNYNNFLLHYKRNNRIISSIQKESILKKQNFKTSILNNRKETNNKYYNVVKMLDRNYDKYLLDIKRSISHLDGNIIRKYNELLKNVNENNVSISNDSYFRDFNLKLNKEAKNKYLYKSTMVLFELFSYILINKALTKLGFVISNKENNINDNIVFVKEDYKIVIMYDRELRENIEDNCYISSLNSSHNKPDFVLVFYKNDNIFNSIIIDAKYRSKESLFLNKDELLKTCYDYYQLVYKKDLRRPKRIVSDVIIFHPDLEDLNFEYEVGYFLGFRIEQNIYNSNSFNFLVELIREKIV